MDSRRRQPQCCSLREPAAARSGAGHPRRVGQPESARDRPSPRRGNRYGRPPRCRPSRSLRHQPDRHDPAPMRAFLWIIEHLLLPRRRANRPVVVYDEWSGLRAARALWFLELFGHPQRAARRRLQGVGARERPFTASSPVPVATEWHGTRREDVLATWRDVPTSLARLGRAGGVILDTRTPENTRHARACRTRRRDSWHRSISSGRAISARTARSSRPPSCRRCSRGLGRHARRGRGRILPGRIPRAPHVSRAAAPRLSQVRNYLGSWREWGDRLDLPLEVPPSA